ncbi:MAG: hypothetical protein M1835_004252 [Candelina submexicana]|nr:MAG: hypothetical protein M1835_004252 [Candelina submexicana]
MGCALQRLLARPSALKVLRTLISAPIPCADLPALPPCQVLRCPVGKTGRRGIVTVANEPTEHPTSGAAQSKSVPAIFKGLPRLVPSIHPGTNNDIFTFERLQYESNVGAGDLDPRLVDTPKYRYNFRFWVEILEFRSRLCGNEGIANIWKGILARDIALPVEGREADTLWRTFLGWGFTDTRALSEIWDYARILQQSSGRRWSALYETIIGHLLEVTPRRAYEWHNRLRKDHPPRPGRLRALLDSACTSKGALNVFYFIYLESEERDMYTGIIPLLCERRLFDSAYKWHNLLIRKGDLPPNSKTVEPLMHHLELYGSPDRLRELTHRMVDAGVSYAGSTAKIFGDSSLISRDIMNRIVGEVHGIEPKTLSDSFCARLFATRAFSVDTVLNGIKMLGVEAIGSLAMQAIALKNPTPLALLNQIGNIKKLGVSIGKSVFTQSLRKAAIENKTQVFLDILYGDQHPDVLEDWKFQEATLAWALEHRQWREVDKTLLILTISSEDSSGTWNLILRAHLKNHNLGMVTQTLEDMRMQNIEVSMVSIRYICQQLLRTRRPGKRPVNFAIPQNDLSLVVSILMSVLRSWTDLPPVTWTEVLKRLGMTGRLQEFEKLALWLADWYTPSSLDRSCRSLAPFRAAAQINQRSGHPSKSAFSTEAEVMPSRLPAAHPRHPLRILFPKEMQSAIIAWSIRKAFTEGKSPNHSVGNVDLRHDKGTSDSNIASTGQPQWARGLHLLKALKSRGVLVHTNHVRKTMKLRLRILYGRGQKSNRVANRIARERNPFKLEEMVKTSDQSWGNRLFGTLGPPEEAETHEAMLSIKAHAMSSEYLKDFRANVNSKQVFRKVRANK